MSDNYGFDFDLVESTFDCRILSYRETLARISEPNVSMARFGDSEIKMLSSSFSIGFQSYSNELRAALHETIRKSGNNLLIGFPPVFRNEQWAKLWSSHFESTRNYFKEVTTFANTAVSRPPCFNELGSEAFEGWQNVWTDKSVAIVAGEGGRFSFSKELFRTAKSVDIIYSVPTNAFEKLDSIMRDIETSPTADVYLLSLGPAATVLAARLSSLGLKALDVGHLSASYNYWLGEGLYPEKIAYQPTTQ